MDQMVLETQQWLNETYGKDSRFKKIDENGKTGWSTIHALTRALQIELGISKTADNFGPGTQSLFSKKWLLISCWMSIRTMRGTTSGRPSRF